MDSIDLGSIGPVFIEKDPKRNRWSVVATLSTWLNRLTPYVHRVSAMFLIASGAYLVYYWVFIARLSSGV